MKTQHTLHEDPTYFTRRPNILYMKTQHTFCHISLSYS